MAKYIFLFMVFILVSLKPITANENVKKVHRLSNVEELIQLRDSLEENSSELSISIEVRSEKEKALIYSIVDGLRKGLDNFE